MAKEAWSKTWDAVWKTLDQGKHYTPNFTEYYRAVIRRRGLPDNRKTSSEHYAGTWDAYQAKLKEKFPNEPPSKPVARIHRPQGTLF